MTAQNLSEQFNSIAVKAVVILVVCAIVSLFLPLEAPGANQEEAAHWLMNTMSAYMAGWFVQVVAMFACSVVFAGAAWQIFPTSPIRAGTIWLLIFLSVIVFLISKFFSIWAVPLMAKALAAGSAESETAQVFLTTLGPSVSFGLGPSLDYLGFWLYANIGILLFRPLFRLSTSAKVAAVALFVCGVLLYLTFAATFIGILSQGDVEAVINPVSILVVTANIALFFHFRAQCTPAPAAANP